MSLMTWFVSKYAEPLIEARVTQRMVEAAGRSEAADDDDWKYTRLTGQTKRDLPPVQHARMLEISHYLYDYNPLAKWLLDTGRNFLVAEGIIVRSTDEKIQTVIDEFWNDPINRMPLKLPQKILELSLFGEQCWPIFINQYTGLMRLANVDPSRIKSVVHDPNNSEEPIGVILRPVSSGNIDGGQDGKKLKIIKNGPDDELFASDTIALRNTFADGECFYYKVNYTSHQSRGISDLFSLADWLDGYEDLMFNTRDRVAYLNAFVWDVMLKGFDDKKIQEWLKNNPPPRPGQLFAHNENIEMNAKAPDLQGRDNDANARLFRNHILGSYAIPEHWFGGAGNVNRATAQEMDLPWFKKLQARQLLIKYMVEDVLLYYMRGVFEKQPELGVGMTESPSDYFEVVMPRMSLDDIQQASGSLTQVANAAGVAQDRGWISFQQAQRLFITASAQLGVDLVVDDLSNNDLVTPPEYTQAPSPTTPSTNGVTSTGSDKPVTVK